MRAQVDEAVESAARAVLQERKLGAPAGLVAKVLQLWQTLRVRFGVCILGPAAAGKSTVLRTLQVPCRCLGSSTAHLPARADNAWTLMCASVIRAL